jgi:hypothetical protein
MLGGAKLQGAQLDGANLQGANLDGADLQAAEHDDRTQWPEGFSPGAVGVVLSPEAHASAGGTLPA